MIWTVLIALWLILSPVVCWMAGRFIRVGMEELQKLNESVDDWESQG